MKNQITTTCPQCATVFRVNPEQLSRCQGLVKCGRCQLIFNGYETVAGSALMPVLTGAEPDTPPVPRRFPFGRLLLWILCLLAFVATLILTRNALVNYWPELRHPLEMLCRPLGLALDLPKRIELWNVESSDMHEDPSDSAKVWLTATLRNHAAFEQAYPSLDLALLDAEGASLEVRRLTPSDYFGTAKAPEGGLEGQREINIRMSLKRGPQRESGYRLNLLYP